MGVRLSRSREPKQTGLREAQDRIRAGEHNGPTGDLAPGYAQANLVALPEEYAFDFLKFCVRNPRSCPVLEVTDAGSHTPSVTAPGDDLRTDVPRYRIYENGSLVDETTDISSYWSGDLVSFLLGCSFTFEKALLSVGLGLAHLDQERNVSMYVTGRECGLSVRLRIVDFIQNRVCHPSVLARMIMTEFERT